MVTFWEVVERADKGPRLDEREFDMRIFRTATSLAKECNLRYDAENPVPSDNQLADDVWEAGLRAAVEL